MHPTIPERYHRGQRVEFAWTDPETGRVYNGEARIKRMNYGGEGVVTGYTLDQVSFPQSGLEEQFFDARSDSSKFVVPLSAIVRCLAS